MPTAPDYLAANTQSLLNLRAMLSRLSEADLRHDLGEGWTIAAMLGHLASYDYRAVELVNRWRRDGAVTASPLDSEMLNLALLPIWLSIPPIRAAALALEAAEAADACVAGLDAALLAGLAAAGTPLKLNRAEHRQEHIDQFEKALAA